MTPPPDSDRRFVSAAAVVAVAALVIYLWRLGTPTLLPDEQIYVVAGGEYVRGLFTTNLEHPPLAKLLFGVGQELTGRPILGSRLVGAVAGLAIAAGLFAAVRHVAGRWWGLAAAALWVVLPHALRFPELGLDRLDRYAMLDPVAAALGLWAVVVALDADRVDTDRVDTDRVDTDRVDTDRVDADGGWRRPLAAGALAGLAAAAKLPGVLFVPAVAAALLTAGGRQSWPRHLRRVAVAGVGALAAVLLAYAPLGAQAPEAIRFMLDFQARHAGDGHTVLLAGQVHDTAPWWSHLYYAWRDDGPALAVALYAAAGTGALAATASRRMRIVLATALAVPAVALSAAPVGLPHYRFLWLPFVVALAVLGVRWLAGRGTAGRVAAGGVLVVALATGAASIATTLGRQPSDYRALARILEDRGLDGATTLVHGYDRILTTYAPDLEVVASLPADVVVLDPKRTDRAPVPGLRARLGGDADRVRVAVDRLEVWLPGGHQDKSLSLPPPPS